MILLGLGLASVALVLVIGTILDALGNRRADEDHHDPTGDPAPPVPSGV